MRKKQRFFADGRVLAASVFMAFLPIQLMTQNLLYDAAQLALPFDRVEPGHLRRPRRWDARPLGRFMLVFGPLSSVFDLATFAVLWWGSAPTPRPSRLRARPAGSPRACSPRRW